jgi:hypothetical protein
MADEKVYVAYKPCKKPDLIVTFKEGDDPINVTTHGGLGYFEDEIGYYHIVGELICTMD